METGDGLNILLICDYVNHHNWMSFLCWYSCYKNLPDAKFSIICNRKLMSYRLFEWTKKCNIYFEIVKENTKENHLEYLFKKNIISKSVILLTPEILAVRELNFEIKSDIQEINENFYVKAKENKVSTFVNYGEGFGKFSISEWINKERHPFLVFNDYFRGELSLNEIKIEELWTKATTLFISLTRN